MQPTPPKVPPPSPDGGLAPGTTLPDGTRIDRVLARTAWMSWYAGTRGETAVHVAIPGPSLRDGFQALEGDLAALAGLEHRAVQRLLSIEPTAAGLALVWEAVEGAPIATWMTSGADGTPTLAFRDAYNVVGHLAAGLAAVLTVGPQGTLSPRSVVVEAGGRVRMMHPVLGRMQLLAQGADREPWASSPYLAPEVRRDAWAVSESSDLYSLGMIALGLFAGAQPTNENRAVLLDRVEELLTPMARELLQACIDDEPGMRVASPQELQHRLGEVLQSVRAAGRSGEVGPAASGSSDVDLFAGIELPPAPGGEASGERWLVHRDGRDYGPYSRAQILEQLERDEIDENTRILDQQDFGMQRLLDVPEFTDAVMDYIPRREKRRLEQQEKREEVVRQVKKKGATTFITAGLGVALLLGVFVWMIQVRPEPYPFDTVVEKFRFEFEVREPEYQGIAADPQLMASLFDFRDPPPPAQARRAGAKARGGASAGGELEEEDPGNVEIALDGNAPNRKLTQQEIKGTLSENVGGLQSCFYEEKRRNPAFRGITVSWSIRPDGRTFNITTKSDTKVSSTLESCVVRGFRRMRFPQFNDTPMNISLPFYMN